MKKARIYVDGASRGNPGPAAIGVVICGPGGASVKSLSEKIGSTTNNIAEYMALLYALQEALLMKVEEVEICSDSELVVKQFNGEYKIKDAALKPLFLLVKHLRQGFKKIRVVHVPREENKLADTQANKALNEFLL